MGNLETFNKREYAETQCQCEKPQTNADRIRNMSDEELAELLNNANIMCEWKKGNCERSCIECTLKWLQAEVKEGAEL